MPSVKKTGPKAKKVTKKTIPAGAEPTVDADKGLRITLSSSLEAKLRAQAEDEGLSLEDFIGELLAESAVLRAWEIVERRSAMSGGGVNHSHAQRNGNGGGRGNFNGKRGRMSSNRYRNIMDDKASFLEYVRNQEKQSR